MWKAVLTLGLVLLYYCFSIGITFYNKWLTKVKGEGGHSCIVVLGHGGFSWTLVPGGLSRWLPQHHAEHCIGPCHHRR